METWWVLAHFILKTIGNLGHLVWRKLHNFFLIPLCKKFVQTFFCLIGFFSNVWLKFLGQGKFIDICTIISADIHRFFSKYFWQRKPAWKNSTLRILRAAKLGNGGPREFHVQPIIFAPIPHPHRPITQLLHRVPKKHYGLWGKKLCPNLAWPPCTRPYSVLHQST